MRHIFWAWLGDLTSFQSVKTNYFTSFCICCKEYDIFFWRKKKYNIHYKVFNFLEYLGQWMSDIWWCHSYQDNNNIEHICCIFGRCVFLSQKSVFPNKSFPQHPMLEIKYLVEIPIKLISNFKALWAHICIYAYY